MGSRGASLLVPISSRALQASEVADPSHHHQPTAVPDRHLVARERGDVDRRTGRDLLGEDEQATVLLRELLEAARDVDRVAHRREIDALAVAHPADDRGARVDADPDLERYLQPLPELAVERGEALHDLAGGGYGLAAAALRLGLDAEERHHAVARELVRDAPGALDRAADGLEVPVQDEHDVVGQPVLRDAREAAPGGEEGRDLPLSALPHVP